MIESTLTQAAERFGVTYLSLGAGVQSSALYAMTSLGMRGCPRADVAIFADTQAEPPWVDEQLDALAAWGAEHGGPPIHIVTNGNIEDDCTTPGSHYAAPPLFTKGDDGRPAPLRRQCTREYKIEPIERHMRRWCLGLRYREQIGSRRVRCLLGISRDEAMRAKPNRKDWIENCHPLIDADMTRKHCEALLTTVGLPIPKKSACVFCPYHSDNFWRDLRDNHPDEWQRAIRFDDAIRDSTQKGVDRPAFLHRSLRPLALVQLGTGHELFGEECEGVCGV